MHLYTLAEDPSSTASRKAYFKDYVEHAFDDFIPLGGDRYFGNDEAIMGGFVD